MYTFVVYDTETTQVVKSFETFAGAKRSATCMNRKSKTVNKYAAIGRTAYVDNIITTRKVRNLMSGEEVEIPSNTPRCLDPSSELYWSM